MIVTRDQITSTRVQVTQMIQQLQQYPNAKHKIIGGQGTLDTLDWLQKKASITEHESACEFQMAVLFISEAKDFIRYMDSYGRVS